MQEQFGLLDADLSAVESSPILAAISLSTAGGGLDCCEEAEVVEVEAIGFVTVAVAVSGDEGPDGDSSTSSATSMSGIVSVSTSASPPSRWLRGGGT